jgi:hypothetical protein
MLKTPPCQKAMRAKHEPKFGSLSPTMVISPYEKEVLESEGKQSIFCFILHTFACLLD